MLRTWCLRVRLFLAIAWRPVTGPGRDEPPMNRLQCWWHYHLPIPIAWRIARDIHDGS